MDDARTRWIAALAAAIEAKWATMSMRESWGVTAARVAADWAAHLAGYEYDADGDISWDAAREAMAREEETP